MQALALLQLKAAGAVKTRVEGSWGCHELLAVVCSVSIGPGPVRCIHGGVSVSERGMAEARPAEQKLHNREHDHTLHFSLI